MPSVPTEAPTRPPAVFQPTHQSVTKPPQQSAHDCNDQEVLYQLDLGIDAYGNETSFEIVDRDSTEVVAYGEGFEADTIYTLAGCIPRSANYTFLLVCFSSQLTKML